MTSRACSSLAVFAIVVLTQRAVVQAAEATRFGTPNILFILADDWGWGDLGCHGNNLVDTPNLDRLAREGTEFYQFHVGGPTCSPSRVAFMTGRFPARYRVHDGIGGTSKNRQHQQVDWLDPHAPTVPRLLKQAGYGLGGYYNAGSTGGMRGRKRSLYEGGVHLPFSVRWPGQVPAGKVNRSTRFAAVDLLPTLCAVAGVSIPADAQLDGENLLSSLLGEEPLRTKPLFWDWNGTDRPAHCWPRWAVRDGTWKLVTDGAGRTELFNLPDDWAEAEDVAEEHPDVVARLTEALNAWRASLPAEPPAEFIGKDGRADRPALDREEKTEEH